MLQTYMSINVVVIGIVQKENQSFRFCENLSQNFATRHRKTNADTAFLMNKIICSILTLQVANIGIDIVLTSFNFLNNCDFLFFESYVTSRCCYARETWSLEFHMISVARLCSSFVAFY